MDHVWTGVASLACWAVAGGALVAWAHEVRRHRSGRRRGITAKMWAAPAATAVAGATGWWLYQTIV